VQQGDPHDPIDPCRMCLTVPQLYDLSKMIDRKVEMIYIMDLEFSKVSFESKGSSSTAATFQQQKNSNLRIENACQDFSIGTLLAVIFLLPIYFNLLFEYGGHNLHTENPRKLTKCSALRVN
jgi:hypothetical protein